MQGRNLTSHTAFATISHTGKEVEAQILLAGRGVKLNSVTNGLMDKCLVPVQNNVNTLDVIMRTFREIGVNTVISHLSAAPDKHAVDTYSYLLKKGYSIEVLIEPPNIQIGSGGAIERFARLHDCQKPILAIVGDMHYDWSKFGNFIDFHKAGTISWFTSSLKMPIMEKYFGLVATKDGSVVGDTKINWGGTTDGYKVLTKGGVIIADRNMYLELFDRYTQLTGAKDVDLYWDLLPFIEEINLKRIVDNESSLLNAYDSEGVILDIGTPELLEFTRKYLNEN